MVCFNVLSDVLVSEDRTLSSVGGSWRGETSDQVSPLTCVLSWLRPLPHLITDPQTDSPGVLTVLHRRRSFIS